MEEFDEAVREGREVLISEFKDRFEAFKDFGEPQDLGAELKKLEEEFAEMRRTAVELGLSLDGFDAAARRARDSWIAEQQASVAGGIRSNIDALGITNLQAFRNQLDVSANVAPMERLQNAIGQFEEARGRALAGELAAVQSVPALGQLVLDLYREIYASGPQTARFERELKGLLDGLITSLTPEGYNPNDLLQLGVNQVEELRKQTTLLIQQLEALRQLAGGGGSKATVASLLGSTLAGTAHNEPVASLLASNTRSNSRDVGRYGLTQARNAQA